LSEWEKKTVPFSHVVSEPRCRPNPLIPDSIDFAAAALPRETRTPIRARDHVIQIVAQHVRLPSEFFLADSANYALALAEDPHCVLTLALACLPFGIPAYVVSSDQGDRL
jgi:hypothetical protein